jgi:phosphoglycolate phosphatase
VNKHPLLVFDWDGTLADSIERIVTSLQYASKTALDIDISEQHARNVIGLGLHEAVCALHPELDEQQHREHLNRVADAYRQHYLYENTVPAPLFAGVEDMLERLKQAGYTLAIATGKSRTGLERTIQEHAVGQLFATTRCAGETKSKPDPAMLHEILNELDYQPASALMIGDSEHDLKMAANANVASIGVTHGVHDQSTLNKHAPLTCLDNITDLPGYLEALQMNRN